MAITRQEAKHQTVYQGRVGDALASFSRKKPENDPTALNQYDGSKAVVRRLGKINLGQNNQGKGLFEIAFSF